MSRKPLAKIHDDVEYFQHQIDGVRQMAKMGSFILADEMGLGKTLQALTVGAIDFESFGAKRILVVTRASLKGNFADDIAEHTNFSWMILEGDPRQRASTLQKFDADVLIVNYEQVVAHVEQFNEMKFDIVIYDEAHDIKSRTSKRTKACFKLEAGRHFVLTGSPLLNQVDDLWALLHRVAPHDWPNYWTFVNRYAVFGGYKDKQIIGIKNEKELREKLTRYMIRREKKDCLDLPEKQIIQIKLDLHPEQKKLYKQAMEELIIEAPGRDTPFELENALTKLLRLKQICGTTATIPGHDDHSTKLDHAVELAQESISGGEPIVVFTQFREVLRCFDRRLKEKDVPVYQLHGDVPIPDRQQIVRNWTANAGAGAPGVMLCMVQVAGVGLTMTAANKCIFLDKLFVPKLNEQAQDRLHRIGQKNVVTIYELLMRGTVEQRIEQILKNKNTVFGAVITTEDTSWKKKLIEAVLDDELSEDE